MHNLQDNILKNWYIQPRKTTVVMPQLLYESSIFSRVKVMYKHPYPPVQSPPGIAVVTVFSQCTLQALWNVVPKKFVAICTAKDQVFPSRLDFLISDRPLVKQQLASDFPIPHTPKQKIGHAHVQVQSLGIHSLQTDCGIWTQIMDTTSYLW